MEKIKLTERMQAVAQLGGKSRFAVDVGTDHGYLAVWLVQNGRAERVAATDIRPGPLSSARAAVERCGLGGRIRLELCNGLDFEGADEADTVYAAGMGGETIEGILRRAPWTKDGARLVLQPQSKLDELCLWLRISGYGIEEARLAAEGERLYVAMAVRGGWSEQLFAEDALKAAEDPLLGRWLEERIARAQRALEGMESAVKRRDTFELRRTLSRLTALRKEL